jgi:hypothetical protein
MISVNGSVGCIASTRCSNIRPAPERGNGPQSNARKDHCQTLSEYERYHMASSGAQRHAHANLRDTLAGQVRQDTISGDAGKQQCQCGE